MPIPIMNYPFVSGESMNPFSGAVSGFNEGYKNSLANSIQAIKAKYAEPEEKAALEKANLYNQYYGQDIMSQIGLRGSQSGLASAEARNKNWITDHPGYMGDDTTKMIQAMKDMGYIKDKINGNQSGNYTPIDNQGTIGGSSPISNAGNTMPSTQNQTTTQNPGLPPVGQAPQNNQQDNQNLGNYYGVQNLGGAQNQFGISPIQTGNPQIDQLIALKFAPKAYQQMMTQGYNWAHLPTEAKNELIAQGAGMGIDATQMSKYINQGLNLQQIAEKEGLDPHNMPDPIYPQTTATKTRNQQVQQVSQELSYLGSATTPLITPYANTVLGKSPQAWKDAFSSKPEDQKRLGRYVAGLSLQSGIAQARVIAEGGRPGLGSTKMVRDSALAGIDKAAPIKLTAIAYKEAQDTINRIIEKGASIRTHTGINPYEKVGKEKGYNSSGGNERILTWNPTTRRLE